MSYGITTVESIARAVHRDLNPVVAAVIPPSAPNPAWGTPEEMIPALPAIPVVGARPPGLGRWTLARRDSRLLYKDNAPPSGGCVSMIGR